MFKHFTFLLIFILRFFKIKIHDELIDGLENTYCNISFMNIRFLKINDDTFEIVSALS